MNMWVMVKASVTASERCNSISAILHDLEINTFENYLKTTSFKFDMLNPHFVFYITEDVLKIILTHILGHMGCAKM